MYIRPKLPEMIKRIVMMELLPDQEAAFLNIFNGVKKEIRSQPGCEGLEVLTSRSGGHLSVWTISLWENESNLDQYRDSDLFRQTWSAVKPLFAAKAKVWTLHSIEEVV